MGSERKLRILHVMGSPSSPFEFELSCFYGKKCIEAGYDKINNYEYVFAVIHPGSEFTFPFDMEEKGSRRMKLGEGISKIEDLSPDIILSHLFCTEASYYLGLFKLLDIPVIGASSEIYSLVIDKAASKSLMDSGLLPVPKGVIVDNSTDLTKLEIGYPCVVKPTTTENSIGITLVNSRESLSDGVELALSYSNQCLIEEFVAGREIRVGVIENSHGELIPLPCIEYKINPNDIRCFEDKLEVGAEKKNKIDLSKTCQFSFLDEKSEPKLVKRLQEVASQNHRLLKCRDFSLLDCRVNEDGEVFILECNVFCSLSPISIINRMAKQGGIRDEELMELIVENVVNRSQIKI